MSVRYVKPSGYWQIDVGVIGSLNEGDASSDHFIIISVILSIRQSYLYTVVMTLPELALMGFAIGLTGALAPGPTLVATIQSALHYGWSSGPRVTLGHIIAELGVVILIAAGISTLPGSVQPLIAFAGGIALIIFGTLTILEARIAVIDTGSTCEKRAGPIMAGLFTSISNPFFWIWWFSVGGALLLSSFSQGISGLLAFIIGHWSADLVWFSLVSLSIHRSRCVLSKSMYRIILGLCGISLIFFGIWFVFQLWVSS